MNPKFSIECIPNIARPFIACLFAFEILLFNYFIVRSIFSSYMKFMQFIDDIPPDEQIRREEEDSRKAQVNTSPSDFH